MDYSGLKGKVIAGIDYGRKRTGMAICDMFHITVNPKYIFDTSSDKFLLEVTNAIKADNVEAVVVGVPFREDDNNDEFISEIYNFINFLEQEIKLSVYTIDEGFSSKAAVREMLNIGYKKKKRAVKGNTDKIAASIILREFLNEISL